METGDRSTVTLTSGAKVTEEMARIGEILKTERAKMLDEIKRWKAERAGA
jgi:hypothetical protein